MAQNLDFNKYIPLRLKNDTLTSLVSNLFNRFVSQEDTLSVTGRIGTPVEGDNQIQEPTLERQENALIPGLYYAAGKEKFVFTFEDFLNKMEVLDIDIENLREWIAERTYNYSPPISYDKFINYGNYFWVGKARLSQTVPAYNPTLDPEYYVIERPAATDPIKMPVKLATTRNINRWINDRPTETFTVTFVSATQFTIDSDIAPGQIFTDQGPGPLHTISAVPGEQTKIIIRTSDSGVPALDAPGTPDYDLAEFTIANGTDAFDPGDEIVLTITYYTSNITFTINSPSLVGKGTVGGIATLSPFMYIDGVQVEVGDRILVKDQTDPSKNGIYIVLQGMQWIRALDANTEASLLGATVYVTDGDIYAGYTFVLTTPGPIIVGTTPLVFDAGTPGLPIPVNEWQLYNFWVHEEDVPKLAAIGITVDNVIQATRPIIEYGRYLHLNSALDGDGFPADASAPNTPTAIPYLQAKTRFNQIPQFDLYRYDGTHAKATSGIWYYVEDPNYDVDSVLQRRVKTTINSDYVFGCAVADDDGRLFYYKNDDDLENIWQPGVATPIQSAPLFVGGDPLSNGGIVFNSVSPTADYQQWIVTFISPTDAEVVGTRSGLVGTATVGVSFVCDDFDITIGAGVSPYVAGDGFTFNIYSLAMPRYVQELMDGSIVNYPGGYAADQAQPIPVGTWLTPGRMFQNMYRETRDEVTFGDFLNHARSVIKWQDGFIGASFGDNNVRSLNFNPGYGGQIREFSSNYPLLSSMLIEQDLSPVTIVSFAEQQYLVALSSVDQFIINELPGFLSSGGSIETTVINPAASDILALEEYFEQLREENVNLTQVFGDSTAGVANWPATLPMLGMGAVLFANQSMKYTPEVVLDPIYNTYVIQHHDGHISQLASFDPLFNRNLTKTPVVRSDGTTSTGFFSETQPPMPYAQQFWFIPSSGLLKVFDVSFDTDVAPVEGTFNGQYWYQRNTNTLYQWDTFTSTWILSVDTVSSRWIDFVPENIRNSLVLAVEQKLYDSIHAAQQLNLNLTYAEVPQTPETDHYMEQELASFAAKYGYDAYAPDYDPTNAFTWNYSQGSFPFLPLPLQIPKWQARWYILYPAYFGSFGGGVLATPRPDLYPWMIGTTLFPPQETKPAGWDAAYANTIATTGTTASVRVISTAAVVPPLMGLPLVDGVLLSTGDSILLINQALPQFNGIYSVSPGGWVRTADPLVEGLTVSVTEGTILAGTTWVLTTPDPITPDITPLTFEQSRVWSDAMWADMVALHPTIRLCVNTATDALLPPYVDPGSYYAANALTNVIPPGINLGYEFGQFGPTELTWRKSLEFKYSLAKAFFRQYPLEFLDKTWGETYLNGDGNLDSLRIERNLMRSLPAQEQLLHGERLRIINDYSPAETKKRITASAITWGPDFGGIVRFEVTHVASFGNVAFDGVDFDALVIPGSSPPPVDGYLGPSATVFSVTVDGDFVGYVLEGWDFSFTHGVGDTAVTFTDAEIEDLGIAYELGDVIEIDFTPNTVTIEIPTIGTDFVYGILGCEGCVADATPDPTAIVTDVQHQPTYSFTPGQAKVFKGLGQWFTNLLRFSSIDEDSSVSTLAYRGWVIDLVHRMGALIRPDTLTITSSNGEIPTTGYSVLLKRALQTQSLWISALRIQLVQMGAKQLNEFGFFVPKGDASDWIFRVEVYNVNHPQVDYNLFGTGATSYDDASGTFTTFKALNGQRTDLDWKRYNNVTATENTTMPLQITGLQKVLNFVYGYVSQLEELGFKINATDTPLIDALTGRNIDWQLEVEKFIDAVYSGMQAGSGAILNPFMDKLYLQTPVGLMGRYTDAKFLDPYSSQACYDVISAVIPLENISVVRTDPQSITYSKTPIFSAHLFTDEFEHALLFKDHFSDDPSSQVIFDQFFGSYMNTAYLSFRRQNEVNSKPTLDGFFLNDDNVLRNPSSSIDALARSYDAGLTFNEPTMAQHALSLIGFQKKDYFNNIGINGQTQLDFWRGMINAKGTNLTINAFTKYKSFLNSSVDEFWAYKLATYGDARERTFPEIKIGPNDCSRQFTGIQFYSSNDVSYSALPLYIQVEAFDDTRWFTIDDLGTVLRFDAQEISETVEVSVDDFAESQYVRLNNIYHTGDAFNPTATGGATLVGANILKVPSDGTYTVSGYTWINPVKLSPVKLFDYSTSTLVDQVGLWHPAIGIHSYAALEIINMTSPVDPAHYNYTTQTVDNPNYLALKPWDSREVGRIWWDTSRLTYIPYYDALMFPNREQRHSRWGSLAEYASVDLYQWTESDYHPSEYNEVAAEQEGDSSIDESIRLSGEVGFTNYYQADRTVTIRAIAWSQKDFVGDNLTSPESFAGKIFDTGERIVLNSGRLTAVGITGGRRLGGWDVSKPLGEVALGTDVSYEIGSLVRVAGPTTSPTLVPSGSLGGIAVDPIANNSVYGTRIGIIDLSDNSDVGNSIYKLRMREVSTGFYQDVVVTDWVSPIATSTLVIPFDQFGIQVTVTRTAPGTISAATLITDLVAGWSSVYIRETIDYSVVVDFPVSVSGDAMSNDSSGLPDDTTYAWRAWDVPSQADLNEDLPAPRNMWYPHLGDPSSIDVTPDVVKEMKDSNNALELISGITINRYASTWGAWHQLVNTDQTKVSDGVTSLTFTFTDETALDANRLSIYVNGVQLAPASIVITDNVVSLVNTDSSPLVLLEGVSVYALYRPYTPTEGELAFNPEDEDDFQIQTWYKVDYQYTQKVIRDAAGNITGTKYYFWVKDKTIPPTGKSMSLVQAKDLLQYGDSKYMIFSRLVSDDNAKSGAAFDSCAISGLGTTVTKTDSYKLRFLRNFTLRDDPEELKLKNVHTEWQLIRQHQPSKIPSQLWTALTNAVCGEDSAGNPLPSQTRVNYDNKYGTNTRFGFENDQIFVDSELAIDSIVNAILNTSLTINIGPMVITDYITALGITPSTTEEQLKEQWFSDPETSRATMSLIYSTARASQVNEIFFSVLDDALANNYEFTDLFKTSMITVNSQTIVSEQTTSEQIGEFY